MFLFVVLFLLLFLILLHLVKIWLKKRRDKCLTGQLYIHTFVVPVNGTSRLSRRLTASPLDYT